MRGEQRKSRRFYDPIQEGKLIICEKPQVYIGQNAFWFVGRKSKGSVTKASRGGGSTDILASRDLWTIPYLGGVFTGVLNDHGYIMPSAKLVWQDSWIYTFWVRFLLIGTFLSPQIRSRNYKNSQRKLRHHFTRSNNFHDDHLST